MTMSSSTQTLADFMAEHKIGGNVRYEGTATTDGWQHHTFRADLNIHGAMYLHNTPYSAGTAHEPRMVRVVDVFGAILSDISSVEGCEDWAEWADDLGLISDAKSAKKAMEDFGEIRARASLLREAIGQEAFDRALEIASEL